MKYRSKKVAAGDQAEFLRIYQAMKRVGFHQLTPGDQLTYAAIYERMNGKPFVPGDEIKKVEGKKQYRVRMIAHNNPHKSK